MLDLETECLAVVASTGQAPMDSVSDLVVGLVVHSKDDILPSPGTKGVYVETATKSYITNRLLMFSFYIVAVVVLLLIMGVRYIVAAHGGFCCTVKYTCKCGCHGY